MAIPFLSDIRLPSAGKVYLWTGHNDNFLKYDLWQASASAGMTIKNIANSGSIILQTNSTTALTLDSSQNATFAGNIILNSRLTFDYGGDHYLEAGTNSLAFKNSSGGSTLVLGFADQAATFYGTLTIPSYIYHQSDPSSDTYFGFSGNDTFVVYTAGGKGIEIDSNREVDLTGNVNMSTGKSIYISGTSGLRLLHDGTDGHVISSTGDLKINNSAQDKDILFRGNDNGSSFTALTLDMSEGGNATFAGTITLGGALLQNTTGDFVIQNNAGAQLDIKSNRGVRLFIDKNADDTSHKFEILSNVSTYSSGNVVASVDQSGNAIFGGDVTIPQFLKHTDDADTYFGFSASNQVLFHVGGGDRLIITSAGDVGIGTSSPGNKLTVATSDDVVAKFLSTDANAKIRIQDDANSAYIGVTNTEVYLGGNGTSSNVGNIRINVGNSNSGQAGYAGFGATPSASAKFKVGAQTDTSQDLNMTGVYSDLNVNGTDALSADRTYRAFFADLDSTATGGNTTNEVRLYGLDSQVTDTGDADLIYAVHGQAYNTKTSALDNITQMVGGRFSALADNSAGTITSAYGIYANARNKNSGIVSGLYGGRFDINSSNSDSNMSNVYGVYAKVEPTNTYSGTITTARGGYFEVECEANNNFNVAHGVQINIDHNGGTITDAFQLYMTTSGTIADDNWGIWSTGAAKHRLDGKIGIGVTPSYDFHLQSSGAPTKVFIENDGSNQASVDLSNDDRHVRLITDSTNAFRIYDQTATADRFKLDNNGFVTLPNAYLTLKNINSHAQIEASSSSLMLKAVNIQAQGNFIPDGTGNRNLGASNRYWAETYTNGVTSGGNIVINSNTPVLTLGVINSSTGNAKVQFYSKNSGTSNGYAVQYNKDTGIDRLEFVDGSGTANIKFNNGGAAEFAGSVTATQINTGQGATEVHLMNQNLRTSDNVQFADLTLTGNLNLYGDINTQNVTNLDVTDKVITVGKGQDEGHSGGSGLLVDGSGASILWDESNDTWDFNKGIDVDGNINVGTQATDILIGDNLGAALEIKEGSNLYMRFNTTNGGEKIEINKPVEATFINASTGFRMASGQAIDFVSTNIGYNSIERNTSVGGLQINTGDTNSMNILDNGNVGLNTTSPEEKLTISTGNVQFRKTTQAANTSLGFLGWKNTYATGTHVAAKIDVLTRNESSNAHDYTNLVFYTWNGYNSLSEKMRIADDGNVGIGYDNPYKKLHLHNPTDSGTPDCQMNFTTGVTEAGDGNGFRVGWNGTVANMYLFENADMRFATNNSERMRISAAGNVGIGETNPSHKITAPSGTNGRVARLGNLEITTQSGTYTGSSIEVTGSNSFITYRSTLGHKFVTRTSGGGNTLEAMTIVPDTGRVGIGTTSPDAKLSVTSTTTNSEDVIYLKSGADNVAEYLGIAFETGVGGNGPHGAIRIYNGPSASDSYMSLLTTTNGGTLTQGLTQNHLGYVGIGTTAPTNPLHVRNGDSSGGNTYSLIKVENGTNHAEYGALSGYARIRAAGNEIMAGSYGATYFYNGGNTSLTLTGTGVGIGTTSPGEKLEVNGSIKLGSMKLENISAGGRIGFNRNTSNGAIYNSSYEAFQIQSNGAGYLETQVYNSSGGYIGSMVLTDDVKLGIGTTAPTYKLSVPSGGIEAGGKITYSKSIGSLNATGFAVAGITTGGNGASCGFIFTCFGHTGAYQRIVYSCYNGTGTWYAKKVIDEGTNQLDVVASANGSTITFTFKATSSTMSYTPRVTVEATGHNINSTYA